MPSDRSTCSSSVVQTVALSLLLDLDGTAQNGDPRFLVERFEHQIRLRRLYRQVARDKEGGKRDQTYRIGTVDYGFLRQAHPQAKRSCRPEKILEALLGQN